MEVHHVTLLAQHLAALPTKRCARCKEWKSRDSFHRSSDKFDGLCPYCKPCVAAYNIINRAKPHRKAQKKAWAANYRQSKKGKAVERRRDKTKERREYSKNHIANWRKKNPEKVIAHKKLNDAIRRRVISREPCQVCGKKPEKINGKNTIDAHHADYSKPLAVKWLCKIHHAEEHYG